MCGVAGKIYFGKKTLESAELERMHRRIEHRGPDDAGIYINPEKKVGLAHRRLAIIDLSPAGHGPMSNASQTVWITFNGEIYNFQGLRSDLEKKGYSFRSNSDTEVILYLWEEYGVECVNFLRGMFAFAIWDEKKKLFFMARDRVGKKPLKYYQGTDFFVFASELKAFLDEPGVPREIDDEAIHHYLTFQYIPHPMTGFKGIKKLPPAHYLHMDLSTGEPRVEIKRYWNLDNSTVLDLPEEEWEARILEKLEESVRIRLMSDVPLGAFLSGGVDSSAIVAMMAKNSAQPVKTFSIGFTLDSHNELPYARQIAERYSTDHQEFIVEPNAIEVLPQLVYHYEEPYADSSALPTFYLSQMTRQHVTVALNGDGGDENFAGYPWYGVLRRNRTYQRLPYPLRALNAKLAHVVHQLIPLRLFRYGELAARGGCKSQAYLHTELLSYFNEREKTSLYSKAFLEKTQRWNPSEMLEHYYRKSGSVDPVSSAQFVDIHTYLPDDLLAKVDIASMMVSLEARSPFLDHEFMEMAAQIPSHLKWRGGSGKYILKKALRNLLPHDLMHRPKKGFSIPINPWFRTSLKQYAEDLLLGADAFPKGMFEEKGIKKLLENHARHGEEGRKIWMLVTLRLWIDRFFKQKTS